MDLIVDLPQVLQVIVIGEWLSDNWATFGRLDSAYCNKKSRPDLLQILNTIHTVPTVRSNSIDLVGWVFLRDMRVRDITIVTSPIEDGVDVEALLVKIGTEATSITFAQNEHNNPHELPLVHIPPFVWPMIVKHCPKLQYIDCENGLALRGLHEVILQCTQLKEINLKGARNLSMEVLQACCRAPHLEVLNLSNAGFVKVSKSIVIRKAEPIMHSLKTLLITGSNLEPATSAALLLRAPNLTRLSLLLIGVVNLPYVTTHCPKLKHCTLYNAPIVDITTATALCQTWSTLQYLALYHNENEMSCTEEALLVLVTQCHTLQRLRVALSRNTFNRDDIDYPITNTEPAASQLVDLQIACVTAATLKSIGNACPNLCALHLVQPTNVTHSPHTTIEDNLSVLENTSVKTVVLENTRLNDDTLLNIVNMEHVYLIHCRGLFTIRGLTTMSTLCPNLASFYISEPPEHITTGVIRGMLDVSSKMRVFAYAARSAESTSNTSAERLVGEMLMTLYPRLQRAILSL